MSDAEILVLIGAGSAFSAEVENDLEERGLIVQTDQPYATVTKEGEALIASSSEACAVIWVESLGDYRHVDPERVCWLHQRPLV